MSGGFLSKGIIGVGIPAGVVVLYLILKKDRRAIRNLRLGWGILLFIFPILLWGGGVAWFESPHYLNEVIRQSLWRFLSHSADHAKPFYYYFLPTLARLFPWILLPLVFLLPKFRSRRPNLFQGELGCFAVAWFVTVFVVLSVSSAKRPLYLAPIYPAFALFAALAWDCLRNESPRMKRYEIYGIVAVYLLFISVHFLVLLPSGKSQSLDPVFEAVARGRNGGPVYLFEPDETLRGAAFFYLGEESPVLEPGEPLPEEFGKVPGTTVIATGDNPDNAFSADLEDMGLHPRFQKDLGKHRRYRVYSNK
jgi:4-amino-4-deoxy-L-arabinose transferase-like glycosyltransferase